jgi:aminopeptidase N
VSGLAPEEVALLNWNWREEVETYPLVFHRAADYANGTGNGNEHNAAYRIISENLDVSIERNGLLTSLATVEVRAEQDGVAVVPLDLYPTLRVSRVESEKGEALDFVQEKKDEDPDFGVVLAKPLKKGETATLKIAYGGKEVVFNKGAGNYYPVARENWYPNASQGLGDYATYRMLFHVPKGLQLIATGTKVSENTDGKITTTEWKTEVPLPVVGFSLGEFVQKEDKFGSPLGGELTIDAYANTQPPEMVSSLSESGPFGTLGTTPMLATEMNQGKVAAQVYTNYFGPLPFAHISLTQQSACNYGQSWPMLVYLPICGFFDSTQQHFLGLNPDDMYWKIVTPHEVAHQWWGQTVGFRSYRDQWMSEGFANTSATIFLQATRPKPDEFLEFWKQQRKLITEKNAEGFRPIDVGPVTMGIRLSSPKTGWDIYQNLVYPKGAYILHMVRMMMWSPKDGDDRFKATMHEFVDTYRLRAATTEDFKAVVEKHMSPQMDLEGNHRMDWFFNQYVYGTDLPAYRFESQVTPNGDGTTALHVRLTQSGVPPSFRMLVPIYLEFTNAKFIRMGSVTITGTKTIDQTLQLPKMPAPIKRALINYNYDVLSTEN